MRKELEYLELAKRSIVNNSVGDPTSYLARANLEYGLAKILYVQEYLGLDMQAYFISLPDFTITRSNTRWLSGFSYGGLLIWGDGSIPLVILDARPNTCGTLVGSFSELPSLRTLLKRVDKVMEKETSDRNPLWNFTRRNHFFNIYENKTASGKDSPTYYFFLHGCPADVKSGRKNTTGLYIDNCVWLQQNCLTIKTPFGLLNVLIEDKAEHYFDCYMKHEVHSREYRVETARNILGDFEEISNETHSGLVNINHQILGCYLVSLNTTLPLSISMHKEAYLITPKRTIWAMLQSSKLGDQIGHIIPYRIDRLALVPHGSGYTIPSLKNGIDVCAVNEKRYYVTEIGDAQAKLIISSISEIPFSFRNLENDMDTLKAEYMDITRVLKPVYSFKV